ncbi:MAG: AraC family transcriptional regulator [Candidatus Neomarinimicrobiota bacterium]
MSVSTTLHIKNMVCDRCVRVVREELEGIGFQVLDVRLGSADVQSSAESLDLEMVRDVLDASGFDLLHDRQAQLVSQIKAAILELVHGGGLEEMNRNFSDYLARNVGRSYSYLSKLFSDLEQITIEKYIILQKIEKVKELLVYDELSLSEIAYMLGYSSTQHLSGQFKTVTGLTPTAFRHDKAGRRRPLDRVKP